MFNLFISAMGNMFAKLFELKSTKIINQETTDILKDKKNCKIAINIAEKIIELSQKYKDKMTFCDKMKLSKLVAKFYKVN